MVKISVCVPIYNMQNAEFFLKRNLDSIIAQTFKNYEIIVSDSSADDKLREFCKKYPVKWVRGIYGMANNTNFALSKAQGKLLKILFQDDYFAHENALQNIDRHFTSSFDWFVTACTHTRGYRLHDNDHFPYYSESENTIGSPSVLTIRDTVLERFDPQFDWVLDLDLYKRIFKAHGKPKILNKVDIVIGLGSHQITNQLSDDHKALEFQLLKQKHE